jgi:predicted kinase
MPKLLIIRGCPGSGKSTLAKSIGCLHIEADMYISGIDGSYNWSPDTVKQSHTWCYNTVCLNLKLGVDVVVSNTFTQIKEMQKYIDFCIEQEILFKVIRCLDDFGNTHNIPKETLIKMKNRFEDYEGEEISSYFSELES